MGARPPQASLLGTQGDKGEGTQARGSGCERMRDAQAGGAGLEGHGSSSSGTAAAAVLVHGSRQRQVSAPYTSVCMETAWGLAKDVGSDSVGLGYSPRLCTPYRQSPRECQRLQSSGP